MRLKLLSLVAAGLGSVFGLTLAVLIWSAQNWPDPILPVIYLSIAFAIVYVPLVVVWFRASKQELTKGVGGGGESAEERAFKRIVGMVAQAFLGLLGLFVVALWNFGIVRAEVIKNMKGHIAIDYGKALSDPSHPVKVAACVAMLEAKGDALVTPMVAGLHGAPQAALECLKIAQATDMRGYRVLGRRLVAGWHRELLNATDADATSSCQIPANLTKVATLSEESDGELMLLQCVVASNSIAVRKCCAAGLSAQGAVFKELGLPENLSKEILLEMFEDLVAAAFRDSLDQEIDVKLSLSTPASQRWVIDTGCSMLGNGDDPQIVHGFFPFAESKRCNVPLDGQARFTTPAPWYPVCGIIADSDDPDVEQVVCDAMNNYLVEVAVKEAKSLVKAGLRARYLQAASDELIKGSAGVAMAAKAADRHDHSNMLMIEIMPPPQPVQGQPGKCYKQEFTGGLRNLKSKRVETTDCGVDYLPGETLEDYLKRKRRKSNGKGFGPEQRARAMEDVKRRLKELRKSQR